MPFINTKTTLPLDVSKKETLSDGLAQIAKDCLGKSENWLMTGFEEKADIYFRKTWTAAAYIEVKLCGHADSAAFSQMTEKICSLYEKELGLPGERLYVSYFPTPDWGWNGKNF